MPKIIDSHTLYPADSGIKSSQGEGTLVDFNRGLPQSLLISSRKVPRVESVGDRNSKALNSRSLAYRTRGA